MITVVRSARVNRPGAGEAYNQRVATMPRPSPHGSPWPRRYFNAGRDALRATLGRDSALAMKATANDWVAVAMLLCVACSGGDDTGRTEVASVGDPPAAGQPAMTPATPSGQGAVVSAVPTEPAIEAPAESLPPEPPGVATEPSAGSDVEDVTGAGEPMPQGMPAVEPATPSEPTSGEPAETAPDPAGEPPVVVVPDTEMDETQPPGEVPADGASVLGVSEMGGSGSSDDRYASGDVTRNGQNYFFMANGWGPGFISQTVSWEGTSFVVESMEGQVGSNYEPASYPTVFCGDYSSERSLECGLPAPLSEIEQLRTGWRWDPAGNTGEFNAAYDIWLGDGDGFAGFAMVWLREPPGQQPAGSLILEDVEVTNVPGTWDIWEGTVYNRVPIINWVRNEGEDTLEMEFDIMDFVRDAEARGLQLPGNVVNAVAVGFEIWEGPISNLATEDFYLDVIPVQ